jgi:hypothetical protein
MPSNVPAITILAASILLTSIGARAAPQPIEPPARTPGPVKAHIAVALPTPSDKFGSQTDVPNSYFGVSGSGGGLLIGLLLGPLGALINQSAIQAGNSKVASDASAFESLNLAQLLHESDPTFELSDVRHPNHFVLTSAARLFAHKENPLLVTCVLKAEYEEPGSKPWKSYYQVNTEGSFMQNDPALKESLRTALKACLAEATQLFLDHVRGDLGAAVMTKIKLTDYTLTMPAYRSLLPQRVVGNDGLSVQRFRQSDVVRVE